MRTVKIYTGAYASGKSENALNEAIKYAKQKKDITLVDFDTVEPAYCLRPIADKLKSYGIHLINQSDYFGLGEAGSYVTNEQINCLKTTDKDIIIDLGYGVTGLDTLDIIADIASEKNMEIYLVVNCAKFETKDTHSIIEYIEFNSGQNQKPWKKITGLISNTHLGDQTTKEDILKGYETLKKASQIISIPIKSISVDIKFKNEFPSLQFDSIPVNFLERHMPEALW